MNSFKTLEELNEYKKQSFEQVFGKVKIQRPESPFKKGTFEDLQFNARPHEVFNLDWSSYYSEDFGNRFLPYVKDFVTAKGKETYDGANLLKGIPKSERKLFLFDDHKYLIFLVNYTYPKGVLAEQRKNRALATEDEVLTFIELEKDDTIDIHFKFGRRFKEYLIEAIKQSGTSKSISSLEEKVYKTDVKKFKLFFKNGMVHDTMMRYILGILGVEKEAVAFSEYNALFTKKVISFVEDFTIAGKYKPYVFIEKSQRAVQLKTDPTVDGGTKIKPNVNEIYIWLVHKDSSFIKVQLGTNVAKDLKEREITQEAIEQIIINEIKAELETNVYSNKAIDRATHKGLGDALIQLWILDRKESSELNTEIFNTNPALFLALQAASFTMEKIESYKFKEYHWNPKLENYLPFIEGDTLFNAQVCGFVNGIIDQVKAIPEMLAFFSKILGSEKEKEAFIKGLKKIFEEGIVQVIIESATKEYKKAIQEGNVERLYYNLAHDVIQIVSLLIGIFQLAKGVASFVNFTKKGLRYIKRYGRKGIDDLKKLNKRQVEEIFDRLDSGSGGFYNYKKIISRNMIKQEEWMSCAAACLVKYADDFNIKISEKKARILAKTTESGTDGKDLFFAMRKVFEDVDIFAKTYFDDLDDLKNFNQMINDANGESFITNIGRYPNKHTIIVDKIKGKDVFIRDPWPLEVDEAFNNGLRGLELENVFNKSQNGVEAILDLQDFQRLWAEGGNIIFKIK
ncbi:Metallopeptidase toxin 4 [Tenacibaculum sp. 190524A02b]|uniref:cysteine peptidase family C39 domain-containing protein n=1 Tax=Tenacibaculum vairaonense TaxID=3137860 RepID=UPI0032B2C38A